MSDNEHPDYAILKTLLGEATPLVKPLFNDQMKKWVAESPLAQEIITILENHPEYYDEVRQHLGDVIPAPKAKGTSA